MTKLAYFFICFSALLSFSCASHNKNTSTAAIGFPIAPYHYLRVEKPSLLKESGAQKMVARCEKVFYEGLASNNEEHFVAALQAIALSHRPIAKNVLEKCLKSSSIPIQLSALEALSILGTEKAIALIHEALQSPYIIIRLQAVWLLLEKGQPNLFSQISALQSKVPTEFFPFFAELYAKEGSSESIQQLQRMAYKEDDETVCAIFLAIYRYRLTSCQEFTLSFLSHSPAVLETIAKALQLFPSTEALERLQVLSKHQSEFVRSQAVASRITLGENEAKSVAREAYRSGNRSILPACMESHERIEFHLPFFQKRDEISTTLYLIESGDNRALESLKKLIVPDPATGENALFRKNSSPGGAIFWWEKEKRGLKEQNDLFIQEQSQRFLEKLFQLASSCLNQNELFSLLSLIAETRRTDLYPIFFSLLGNLSKEQCSTLINQFQDALGSPYLRAYIALADMKKRGVFNPDVMKNCFEIARNEKRSLENYRCPLPYMLSNRPDSKNGFVFDASLYLYMTACQISLELAQDEVAILLYEELEKAPNYFRPYIAAALLETMS